MRDIAKNYHWQVLDEIDVAERNMFSRVARCRFACEAPPTCPQISLPWASIGLLVVGLSISKVQRCSKI
jgi:hypothetical protein